MLGVGPQCSVANPTSALKLLLEVPSWRSSVRSARSQPQLQSRSQKKTKCGPNPRPVRWCSDAHLQTTPASWAARPPTTEPPSMLNSQRKPARPHASSERISTCAVPHKYVGRPLARVGHRSASTLNASNEDRASHILAQLARPRARTPDHRHAPATCAEMPPVMRRRTQSASAPPKTKKTESNDFPRPT